MSPRSSSPLRLEYVLLGSIRRKPVHGYELLRMWNEPHGINIIWRVKPGLIYASLEKLEKLGFLAHEVIAGETSPDRKVYRLTLAGEQAFLCWMQTVVTTARDFRQEFLAKMYFYNDVEKSVLIDLFDRQISLCQRWLASLQTQLPGANEFEKQVLTFRIHQVRSILAWLQEIMPAI